MQLILLTKKAHEIRGDGLRQVILTDFIRDDDLEAGGSPSNVQLGAWPIFRALVDAAAPADRSTVALLTGRLAVLHRDHLPALGEGLIGLFSDYDARVHIVYASTLVQDERVVTSA